ncbi:MAG: hypothetical protein AAGC84_01065 [Pseudomonas sp.]
MTVLIDDLIDQAYGYSPLANTPAIYRYYSEHSLARRAQLRKGNRPFILAGKKHQQETGYFYINAWMLGEIALGLEEAEDDMSVAVLFRDSDGTNSSRADLWQVKYDSMESGFKRANYERGVPMLPRPKSEAWLLCAAKPNPYQHCGQLEELPGNDNSPHSAKRQLDAALNNLTSTQNLVAWLQANRFDSDSAAGQMHSYAAFKNRFLAVL